MATALIAVPLFIAFSFLLTHLSGDRKVTALNDRIRNDTIIMDGLAAENANLNERLSDMWAYKKDSERKSSIIKELEEELDSAREMSCPSEGAGLKREDVIIKAEALGP